MKKVLVAAVVLVIGVAIWWSRETAHAPEVGLAPGATAPSAPVVPAAANLGTDGHEAVRSGTTAKPIPAPAPAAGEPRAAVPDPLPADGLPTDFLELASNLNRADLLGFQDKIRTNVHARIEAFRAERGGGPSRTVYAEKGRDPLSVAVEHVPAGYVGFAVSTGYDKEHASEGFDLYLYPADAEPEWATELLELKWIDARLPTMRE